MWKKIKRAYKKKQIKDCFVGFLKRERNKTCYHCEYQQECKKMEERGKM